MANLVASLLVRLVDRLSAPARSAARAVGDIGRAQKAAQAASAQWSRGLEELDDKLGRLANASLVTQGLDQAGQRLIRPLANATRAASAFDAGMTGIGITADLTDRQLIPLRNTILKTAADLGALPATVQGTFGAVLAEGVYKTETELSRAGVAVSRFQRLMGAMGENISDEEAGAFSAALGSSLKLRADELDRANAMVLRSAKQGGVSGAVLARNLPAQTGALAGLSFANDVGLADLLAANQVAKRLAGTSDQAANNVTNLFAALASPETIRRFGEIGVNLEKEIKKGVAAGRSPLESLATLVQQKTGGDQFRIGELFGDRQARDAIMALVQNLDDFKAMSAELRQDDALPSYLADLERAAQGPAASFARYTTSMGRAGIATGTILAPAVSVAADALGRIANWMSAASENGSLLAKAAVWAVAGFAGFAVAAGAVGHAVVGVLGPLYIMRSLLGTMGGAAIKGGIANIILGFGRMRVAAIGATSAMNFNVVAGGLARLAPIFGRARMAALAFNIAMMANPFGLVIAGVAAAVAVVAVAALVVRKYWQPIQAFFGGVGQALGEAFGPSLSAIGSALAPLKPLWDGVTGAVSGFFGWIGRLLQPMQATKGQLDSAANAGQRFGRLLVTVFNYSPIGLFVTAVKSGISAVRAVLAWRPLDTLRSAWSGVTGFFNGWRNLFSGFGRAMMQGLIGGIRAMLGEVLGAVSGVASGAVNRFKGVLGIRSPSRVFAQLGGYSMEGLTQGLTRNASAPLGALAALGAAMTAATPVIAAPGQVALAGLQAASAPPGVAASAQRAAPTEIHHHHNYGAVTIHMNGATVTARDVAREIARQQQADRRAAIFDGGQG